MKKLFVLSTAVLVALSISSGAFAEKKTIVVDDKKVKKIEESGAFLGIYMEDMDEDMMKEIDYPKSTGVLITGIVDDSPAEEIGLLEDDVIYTFDGEKVADSKQLAEMVGARKPGDEVKIVIYRDGKKKTFDLSLGEKKTAYVTIDMDDYDDIAAKAYVRALGRGGGMWSVGDELALLGRRGMMGVKLHELDADLAPYFKVGEGEGVLVLGVMEDSPAEKAGIRGGDVIVMIDDEAVGEIDDVLEALSDAVDKESDKEDDNGVEAKVSVTVVRNGKKKTFEVDINDDFTMQEEFMLKGPYMHELKHLDMMKNPPLKAYKLQEVEEQKLETKMKALEKELDELREKLKELEKK